MAEKHELGFFLVRYVPDALKDEFVNIGVLLVGDGADAGYAEVRFTRNWRRVLCLDPGADLVWLQALERDIRMRLQDVGSRADTLYRLQDLCSNVIQLSPSKGCLGEEPAREIENLAKLYLEAAPQQAGQRAPSGRQRIVAAMREAFEKEGLSGFLKFDMPIAEYTKAGDPLKIDLAYRVTGSEDPQWDGVLKMFQAVPLGRNVDVAKALAFSYPQLAEGAATKKLQTFMTAVVEDNLDRKEQGVAFALAMMQQSRIVVAAVAEMPRFAEEARLELRAGGSRLD
jgi:Protein of unknown function (DUF3037)